MDQMVSVFRSADSSAQEDAATVQEMLTAEGVPAKVVDDSAPGVPSGAWEVLVAAADSTRAEALVAANPIVGDGKAADDSADLDMVTVFRSAGSTSEMEAVQVQSLLESNGVEAMLVADSRLPNLPDEVRVPREHATQARRLIADALSVGTAGAEEAEAEGEN
jgi:hypothetical protein